MSSGPPNFESSKLYFRIGEVAAIVGVEPHVLRYWEREFRTIRPTKSAKGQRVYSRRDLENLLRVRDLLYKEGFTIAGAKKKLQRKDAPTSEPELAAQTLDAPRAPHDSPVLADPHELGREESGSHDDEGEREGDAAEGINLKTRQTLVDLRSEIEAFLADER